MTGKIDVHNGGSEPHHVLVDTAGYDIASVQIQTLLGGQTDGVIAAMHSNDTDPASFAAFSTPVSWSADETTEIDCSGFRFLRVGQSTAETGGAWRVFVNVELKSTLTR